VLLQANSTRREAARRMKEELEENNIRVLGAILYGRTFPIPEAIYKRL
jgi:Mrp family chromosome partitioning ATPase